MKRFKSFWYTESGVNFIPQNQIFVHLTCKVMEQHRTLRNSTMSLSIINRLELSIRSCTWINYQSTKLSLFFDHEKLFTVASLRTHKMIWHV